MKKFKWLIIGAVVLALLIGAYFIVSELAKEEEPVEEETEEIVVTDESNNEITTIAYKNSYGEVNFSKLTGAWGYSADTAMPVSQSFVEEMASKLIKITAAREITGQGNESDYGFDAPTLELTVGTRGGNVHSLVVGALNDISNNYYLKYNDRIFMIDSTIVDATNYELFAALDTHTLPQVSEEDILSVTVNGEEGNKEGYASVSVGIPENYKNKEKYGFDGTENKVVLKYTVTSEVKDDAGNVTSSVDTETEYEFSYTTVDGTNYAMLENDPIIYMVTGIEALTVSEDTTDTAEASDTSDAADSAEASDTADSAETK